MREAETKNGDSGETYKPGLNMKSGALNLSKSA